MAGAPIFGGQTGGGWLAGDPACFEDPICELVALRDGKKMLWEVLGKSLREVS